MKIRWLAGALRSLRAVYNYIRADNPKAAASVIERIETAVARLAEHPSLGRPGRREGTRELVLPGIPFVIIYSLEGDEVWILRVFHTSQDWPTRTN